MRSRADAADARRVRSEASRGLPKDWDTAWMRVRSGREARMMRVRAHERVKARMRAVRIVVRCWMMEPVARDDARRTSSDSLRSWVRNEEQPKKKKKKDGPGERGHEACWCHGVVGGIEPGHVFGGDGSIDVRAKCADVGLAGGDPESRSDAAEDESGCCEGEELECSGADALEETRHVLLGRVGEGEAREGFKGVSDDGGHVGRDSACNDGCGDGWEGEEEKDASWQKGKKGERRRRRWWWWWWWWWLC